MKRRTVLLGLLVAGAAMPAEASSYRQIYPRPAGDVYAALVQVMPGLGYKVRSENADLHRLLISAGMSAWSLGETMTIAVVDEGPERSALELDGELKMTSNVLAKGRVMKHFERIAGAVSDALKQTS